MVTARRKPEIISASCMLTDQVGQAVFIRAQANGFYKVWRCDPTSETKMPAVGVIIAKWGTTNCLVQLYGEMRNLYNGLIPGRRYFVGLDGRPTLAEDFGDPGPGERYRIQPLGVSLDIQVLLLGPSDMVVRVG
jgi:hypothetical protein